MVFVDPMNRINSFQLRADSIADTVIQLMTSEDGDFVIFQPAIPLEVTSYVTEPPIKTRPLNDDSDMRTLAEAIAIFAGKDFVKWQGTALLESQKAAEWRCQSTAFVASLAKEPWTPEVSVSDDGTITARFGSVLATVKMDKLTLKFSGKSAERRAARQGAHAKGVRHRILPRSAPGRRRHRGSFQYHGGRFGQSRAKTPKGGPHAGVLCIKPRTGSIVLREPFLG